MVKIVVLFLMSIGLFAQTNTLDKACLSCHKAQQIPSNVIYKRYLLKYSTDIKMQNAIFSYLKNPQKSTSIMPPQFFLKFPMKEALHFDNQELHKNIKAYLEEFNIKKKFILK